MYIGIDGGGTKTKTMLVDSDMTILHTEETGPSSIRTVPIEESLKNIHGGIDACIQHADGPIEGVFAGLGDVAGEEDSAYMVRRLKEHPDLKTSVIHVKNDVYNAHTGALDGNHGIAVILGTGSVAFGKDKDGNTHRAGGYSYKEGDYGSAYGLGSLALQTLGKAFDNRIDASPFTDALLKHFGITSFFDMVNMYDEYHTKRTDVAKLAPMVTGYAAKGDKNALDIVEKATDEVMLMIKAIDRSLTITNKEVAIIGSLGQSKTVYTKRLYEKIHSYDSEYDVFNAKKDPAYGAALLARQFSEVSSETP